MAKKNFLTTSQAAELLSVAPDTVLKWVKAGKLKSHRTLGGHFRIPRDELLLLSSRLSENSPSASPLNHSSLYQYCWEYLAQGDEIKSECKNCLTFRSRSKRCYELRDLPESLGCLRMACETTCEECDYYKLMNGIGINVVILSENKKILSDSEEEIQKSSIFIEFADNEYVCAQKIQNFRPDFIVVDCALGKKRTGVMCANLFDDPRIPVARIILASKTKKLNEYCDKEIFGWIRKPFSLQQLKDCVEVTQ